MSAISNDSAAARRIGLAMVAVAAVCIFGACLFTCPPAYSQSHRESDSLLASVVSLLGLANANGTRSAYPTLRGVEIRDLFFHLGAAALMVLLGVRLLAAGARPRMTSEDLFDLRRHAASPYFWWALLLFVSAVSSYFSHANDVALGGVLLRMLTFGWWLPLALVLSRRNAMRLAWILAIAVTLMALLGIWYFLARTDWHFRFPFVDGGRLRYPVGNELWFGACLLPAIFIGAGGLLSARDHSASRSGLPTLILAGIVVAVCFFALYLTRSRSSIVGVFAGIGFAVFLIVPKRQRMLVVLVAVLIALGGALFVQKLRVGGKMGERAHSIRTRLNHEWPYALTLWFARPVGGHGEGGYTMQAGQLARAEQLEDPNTIAPDGWAWTVEAHNEYLQLLADVGITGALGFAGALFVTLFWTVRFVDARRDAPGGAHERALAIGLGAAVVAIAIEEGASVGLRHPGLPPLFFTAWACLWALARSARPEPQRETGSAPEPSLTKTRESQPPEPEDKPLPSSTMRLGGIVAVLAGIGLGFAGVQDWRAARAQFDADLDIRDNRFAEAIKLADWAGRFGLDPMRKLVSRELAVEARVAEFTRRIENADKPPDDETMRLAQDATIRSTELYNDVPRFLGLSRLKWQLSLARSAAHAMRGEPDLAREYRSDYVKWLAQCRQDEPFDIEYVARLWSEYPAPAPLDRLLWLRAWLRRNFMAAEPAFGQLLQSFALQIPSAKEALDQQLGIAMEDAERAPDAWKDELSPETFRVAAAIAEAQGRSQVALERVDQAIEMYEAAGGRLFLGHAAAILESANLRFRADPTGDPQPILLLLVRGVEVMDGPLAASTESEKLKLPLPRAFGQLRLAILLAHDREDEAREQVKVLAPDAGERSDTLLADAYARLAMQIMTTDRYPALIEKWIARAQTLSPDSPEPPLARLRHALLRGDDDDAFAAADRLIQVVPERDAAFGVLAQIEPGAPQSSAWLRLRQKYADFPPAPTPATQPATQPDSGPAPATAPTTVPANEVAAGAESTSDE